MNKWEVLEKKLKLCKRTKWKFYNKVKHSRPESFKVPSMHSVPDCRRVSEVEGRSIEIMQPEK